MSRIKRVCYKTKFSIRLGKANFVENMSLLNEMPHVYDLDGIHFRKIQNIVINSWQKYKYAIKKKIK